MRRTVWRSVTALGAAALVATQVLIVIFAGGSDGAHAGAANAASPPVPASVGEAFRSTWARTDEPVLDGRVVRTWMWGPHPNSDIEYEPYAEASGGQRAVLYYDKARMEVTHPDGDSSSPWYVTNGLLVVELVTGRIQVGDDAWLPATPAAINVAGDPDDPDSPTYRTIGKVLDRPAGQIDAVLNERLQRDGTVSVDPALERYDARIAAIDDVTQHGIATPFWKLMNERGLVLVGGVLVEDQFVRDPVYATGRPISEAYWTTVRVQGIEHDVLLQCFERRCLTWTPDNPEGWQAESGNVGLHYLAWRAAVDVEAPSATSTSETDASGTKEPPTEKPSDNTTHPRRSTSTKTGTVTSTSSAATTFTPTGTLTSNATGTPTYTPTGTSTASPTYTPTGTSTASPTYTPTSTSTASPTYTPTGTSTASPTYTATSTSTSSPN